MEWLLGVLLVLAFTGCVSVFVVVRVWQAVRRRALLAADRARLNARSWGVGAPAELARLRRELTRSVDGLRRALAVARATHAPLGDVPVLLGRLEVAAAAVDGELRMLEAVRDQGRLGSMLQAPRSRALALVESADNLAHGLAEAGAGGAVDVSLLQAECAIEAEALREGRRVQPGLGTAMPPAPPAPPPARRLPEQPSA